MIMDTLTLKRMQELVAKGEVVVPKWDLSTFPGITNPSAYMGRTWVAKQELMFYHIVAGRRSGKTFRNLDMLLSGLLWNELRRFRAVRKTARPKETLGAQLSTAFLFTALTDGRLGDNLDDA